MKTIGSTFGILDSSLMSGIITNMMLSLFLGLSMKQIWNLINTLQILSHIPMLSLTLPSNLSICLKTIIDISNISIIPKSVTSYIFNEITDFTASQNTNFQ